jgi:hypothetical protein
MTSNYQKATELLHEAAVPPSAALGAAAAYASLAVADELRLLREQRDRERAEAPRQP